VSREQFFEAFTIARSMGFAVSENVFLSKYLFFNFHILPKLLETCVMLIKILIIK
jgi:hypothetical protein